MANEEQMEIIRRGVSAWNKWRAENPQTHIDLSKADLHKEDLSFADFCGADLTGANLRWTNLSHANFKLASLVEANLYQADLYKANIVAANLPGAYLSSAKLMGANLSGSNLRNACLRAANLNGANFYTAYLHGADLSGANLIQANLVETTLEDANLTGCMIYGISAWSLNLRNAIQKDLVITPSRQPAITVDNLEVAQFIYLLLHNEKIRHVIDTITSKVVLILGRFMPERKAVLDAIREELRKHDYTPVLFDFDKTHGRDFTETISTLAHMARFIIADITDAKSVPIELEHIVPQLPSVPVQPLILKSDCEYALFEHIRR